MKKYHQYAIMALAFVLPLYAKLIPPFIILTLVLALFSYSAISFKQLPKIIWLFPAFLLLHAIGLLYTSNFDKGAFDLEVKLSFLILPIALLPVIKTKFNKQHLYKAFVAGCVVASIICFGIASYEFFYEKWLISQKLYNLNYGVNFFLSARFSYFMHPSYFALYLIMALSLVLFQFVQLNKFVRLICILLMLLALLLLASKSGLITLAILLLLYLIKLRNLKLTLVFLAFVTVVFISLFMVAPEFANKFLGMSKAVTEETVDANSTESSTARVLVWGSAVEVYKASPIIGFGTGSANDKLLEKYAANGYKGILEKKLNAHNQFLQTAISLGLPGLIALLSIFSVAFYRFVQARHFLGLLLLIVLLVNFFVESMLETQAGVVFFVFWIIIEILNTHQVKSTEQ